MRSHARVVGIVDQEHRTATGMVAFDLRAQPPAHFFRQVGIHQHEPGRLACQVLHQCGDVLGMLDPQVGQVRPQQDAEAGEHPARLCDDQDPGERSWHRHIRFWAGQCLHKRFIAG